MRAVVQRAKEASVVVGDGIVGSIEKGLLVFLGVGKEDDESDADYLAAKIIGLRIFEDNAGKMNLSVNDVGGALLVISQFTLFGDCRKGKRPSFTHAADPDTANKLYEYFVEKAKSHGVQVATGQFQTKMAVGLVNDGPVTILIDSKKSF